MRLIDADALKLDIVDEGQKSKRYKLGEFWELNKDEIWNVIDRQPTIEPVRGTGYRDGYKRGKRAGYKKGMVKRQRKTVDVIKDFHDYQVGWLTSHHDITLSPEEENLILNFLHDTADCYVLEVGALR